MLVVKILKCEERSLGGEKKDPNNTEEISVKIKVYLNIPRLKTEENKGIIFETAPQVLIAEENISFKEMKEIMSLYGYKNWKEVRLHLEKKYYNYFKEIFKD